jgi:hypothetical protein
MSRSIYGKKEEQAPGGVPALLPHKEEKGVTISYRTLPERK